MSQILSELDNSTSKYILIIAWFALTDTRGVIIEGYQSYREKHLFVNKMQARRTLVAY